MEAARRDATAFQRVITMWIETYCIRAIGEEEKAAGGGQESELKSERNNSIQWQFVLCCSFQIPTGHGALRCLIPVAFRGGGSSQNIPKDDPGEFAAPPTAAAKKSLKNGSTNNIMRLPIGNNAAKKGGLMTPKTFKENPIKANVPVIREVSVTPLAYRRFDSSG